MNPEATLCVIPLGQGRGLCIGHAPRTSVSRTQRPFVWARVVVVQTDRPEVRAAILVGKAGKLILGALALEALALVVDSR